MLGFLQRKQGNFLPSGSFHLSEERDTKPINLELGKILVIDNIPAKEENQIRMSDSVEEMLLLEPLYWEDTLEEMPVQQRTC